MEWDWAEAGKTWLQLLDALQPPVIRRGGVKFPDPLASPFGDVIEGVGTPDDARRELKRRLFAELYDGRDWWKTESESRGESEMPSLDDAALEREALAEVREERLAAAKERVKARIAAALSSLGEDTYAEHDVLRFTKTFASGTYTYAAIKAAGNWFITGRVGERNLNGMTWDSFTLWLVSGTPVTELTVMAPVSGEKSDGIPDKRETPR